MALLREFWNFDQTKNPSLFYKKFESLNSFFESTKASPENLYNTQKQVLIAAYSGKEPYKQLNQFLKDVLGDKQGTEEDLFARLVKGINEGLDAFRSRENKWNPNWDSERRQGIYYNELNQRVSELTSLVNKVKGGEPIPMPSIDPIKNAISNHSYNDFIAAKGQFLEDVGTWIIECAGLTGFTTGAWKAKDTFFNEDSANSIIEDSMGLLFNDTTKFQNSSGAGFLQVSIVGYNNANNKRRENRKLQQWVNSIQELNGLTVINGKVKIATNIDSPQQFAQMMQLINNHPMANGKLSVTLGEDLYKNIQKLSVNIQAKSNIERHLTNDGNRNLYKINPQDKYFNQLSEFSKTKTQTAVKPEERQAPYQGFAAYVNYNLSHNIMNTVYARNEFYLTQEGFTDLATLMQKRHFYIRIADAALSYEQFLENSFRTVYSSTNDNIYN